MITVQEYDRLRMEQLIKNQKQYTLGEFLFAARQIMGLPRIKAAAFLHLSGQSVMNAENDKTVPPRHKIEAYAALYGIPFDILWRKAQKAKWAKEQAQEPKMVKKKGER